MLVINRLFLLLSSWKFLVICYPSKIFEELHSYRDYEGITQYTFSPVRDFSLYKMSSLPTARSIPINSPHSVRQSTHQLRSLETNFSVPMEKHISYKVLSYPDTIVRNPLHLPQSSHLFNNEYASQISGNQKMNFAEHMRTYRTLSSEPSIQQNTNIQDSSLSKSDQNGNLPSKYSTRPEIPEYKTTQQISNTPKQEYNHYKSTHYLRKRPAITNEERLHVTVRASGVPPSPRNKTILHEMNSSLKEKHDWVNSSGIKFYSSGHEFTQAEESCFQQGKVLFEKDGMCYKLLEAGPCNRERQEWLVLDKELINKSNGRLHAVCQHCPCCDKDFRAVFWPGDGQCHHLLRESNKLCPLPGTTLQIDPFGEGECECTKNPPHAHLESDDPDDNGEMLSCYPLYRRGPCAPGHILVQSDHRNVIKRAHCIRDPCASYNTEHQKPNQSIFAWWEGKCYRLGTRGPCKSGGATFNIHPVSQRPACITRTNNIVELPERCSSQTEKENPECQKEVSLPTEEQYVAELLHSAEKKRRRRRRTNK